MISVLYVDDEPGMREVAQIFLEDAGGFTFTAFASAKKALESPEILSYDVIVSDYMMPGMDGIAFLKAVRQRSADIPFILFTGRGREEVVIEAINNGADFYLQKGGDPDAQFAELAHKIRQAVRRRMAEQDRIKSEEKFARLFMANPSLEAISDFTTGNLIEINDAFICTTGYSRDDLIGKTTRDIGLFIDYADRERMAQVITSGKIIQNFETKIRTKSGDIRTLDFTGQRVMVGNTDILFTQAVDITERKRLERDLEREHRELQASYEQITAAEEELREQYEELARSEHQVRTNEERLIMAQKIGHTGSWEYNLVTNEIWGSAEGLHIFGFHRGAGNFPIDEIEACILERYREQVHQALVDLLTKGQEYNLEYAINPADGSAQRTVHSIARLDKDASGKSLRVIGVLQDITERKKAEEALKKSEEKYRLLTENTYDIIYSADLEGRITHVSPHIARYGYTPEQLISLRISDVIDEKDLAEVQEDMQTTLETGKPTRTVFRLKSSSEKPVWFEDNGTVMKNADGVVVGISGVLRDITERKKAEEALRESEAKLRRLADNAPDMIYRMTLPEGKYEYVSPASFAMTGYTPEEFYADPDLIKRLIHPDWHEYFRQQWKALLEKKAPPFYEYQIIDRAGNTRWFNQRNMLVSDEQGNPVAIEGIVTDITRQKKTERDLRRSELRFLAVNENAGSWIWEVDPDGIYRYSSPAVNKLLGYRPDELIGKIHFYDLLDPTVRDNLKDAALTAFSSHEPFRNFVNLNRHKNGTPVLMSTSGTPVFDEDGTFTGYCGVDEDITERTASESAMRALVRSMVGTTGLDSLRKITENISSWLGADCVMVGQIQPDLQTVKVLSMILDGKQVHGFSYSLKGTPCENVSEKGYCVYPDDVARSFPESKDLVEMKIRGYIGTPMRDSRGDVIGILCVLSRSPVPSTPRVQEIIDIIAVKAAAEIERIAIERELEESRVMLAKAMDLANLVNWEYDPKTGLFIFNDHFYSLYATSVEREGGYQMAPEKYIRELVHPEDRDGVTATFTRDPSTVNHPDQELQMEHRIIRRDGEIRNIVVRVGVSADAGEQKIRIHGANQDITERKRAEEALRQAHKKLHLLSGITRHDISNQLLALNGFVGFLHKKVTDPALETYFTRITKATNQINSMIAFTKEYEKIGLHAPVWQVLATVLDDAGKGILPGQVLLKNDLPAGTEVYADPLIIKAFFNLLDNSVRHGMRVTEIRVSALQTGEDLVVVWEDNGIGIDQEEKELIFEKGFGKNTGLGLFLSREILSLTGITITETGKPGAGARFEMVVPKGAWRRERGNA